MQSNYFLVTVFVQLKILLLVHKLNPLIITLKPQRN